MTETEWFASTDPDAMLTALGRGLSERKKRLFACACCRRVLSRIPDDRVHATLDVSEALADRAATREQLAAAYSVAWEVYEAAMSSGTPEEPFTDAVEQACGEKLVDVAEIAAAVRLDPAICDDPSPADRRFTRRELKAQASLVRDIFGNTFRLLLEGWLSGEWDDDGDGDLYVTYRGVQHKVGLRMEPADRYRWLRRMNEIMAGDYDLRGFRHTLGDDTHCFLPARCDWGAAMEEAFPKEIQRVFAKITQRSRFS